MKSKHILILGATSDIGKAMAHAYAKENTKITLAARSLDHLNPIKSDLEIRFNVSVDIIEFDALDYKSHIKIVNSIDPVPDVVVCIFGVLGDQEEAQNDWVQASKIMETNYIGATSILEGFAKRMILQNKGVIVGISSVAGDRGRQSNYFYGSSKAAFTSYLSGLRNRLFKEKIHVLTVKPGFVKTKMTEGLDLPPLLTASPEQVASAIKRAVEKRKNSIYVLPIWRLIMFVIRAIPESIFKRLKL
ncbi:MAG: SDR family oxidoreductase [Bacteroidota bacterium]